MIYMKTNLAVADNTGAKKVQCIKVLGGSHKDCASVADVIVVSIRDAVPNARVKEGDVCRAVVVRVAKEVKRHDGSSIKFYENAVVLVNKQGEPMGSRVFGPVDRKLRSAGFMRIVSLAPEVL